MKSHITTKRGDHGTAVALNGDTYSKAHVLMECVGCVDELRAQTALLRLRIIEKRPRHYKETEDFLFWLLHIFFLIGSECSDAGGKHPEHHPRRIGPRDVEDLEAEQEHLERQTPLMRCFIVSASNTLSAQADICVTVARRLERTVVRLNEAVPEFESEHILAFVNRLSDYLFVLARTLDAGSQLGVDYELLGPPEGEEGGA